MVSVRGLLLLALAGLAVGMAAVALTGLFGGRSLFGVAGVLAFALIVLVTRKVAGPLLLTLILLLPLQNVPLLHTSNILRAGGADPGMTIYPSDLPMLGLLLYGIYRMPGLVGGPRSSLRRICIAGCLYVAWGLASGLWSNVPDLTYAQAIRDTAAVATFLVAACVLRDQGNRTFFTIGVITSVSLQSILAVVQWHSSGTFQASFLGVSALGYDLTDPTIPRAGAAFGHPNIFGSYLDLTLPLVAVMAFSERQTLIRWAARAALVAGVCGLSVTLSRSALVGAAVGLFVLLVYLLRRRSVSWQMIAAPGTAILALGLVQGLGLTDALLYRISESDPTTALRPALMLTAANVVLSHPLGGVGLNTFGEFVQSHWSLAADSVPSVPVPVHNIYLLIGAETGVVGLILYLYWAGVPVLRALRSTWNQANARSWVLIGVTAGLLALGAQGLFDWTLRTEAVEMTFALQLGLIVGLLYVKPGQTQPA